MLGKIAATPAAHPSYLSSPAAATEEEPIMLGKIAATPAAHPSYLSSPAAATLYGKILGFVLRRPSQDKLRCNIYAAITVHCAASRSKFISLYAHGNTR